MDPLTFEAGSFVLTIEDRRQSTSTSAEGRTLAHLSLSVGTQNLTAWRDTEDENEFDRLLDVPIVDIAYWLVSSWDELLFGLEEPLLASDAKRTPAERWFLTRFAPAALARAEGWAETHCLEFAGSDFAVPNVVFQRRDDFMEVSWFPAPEPDPGNSAQFTSEPGSALVSVSAFSALCRRVVQWAADSVVGLRNDPRVDAIRKFLADDGSAIANRILRTWYPDWSSARFKLPSADLAAFGVAGSVSSPAFMLLRSAAQAIAASEAKQLWTRFEAVASGGTPANLADLRTGLSASLDPLAPWVSGYRLAQAVRFERLKVATERIDIEALLKERQVTVEPYEFDDASIDGACFLNNNGVAVAFYNPKGRLSRTAAGRRTTLAHELCHLLFDVDGNALGQLDVRANRKHGPAGLLEKRANAFAAELLLPSQVVMAKSPRGKLSRGALDALTRIYAVGAQVVEHQAENHGISVASR